LWSKGGVVRVSAGTGEGGVLRGGLEAVARIGGRHHTPLGVTRARRVSPFKEWDLGSRIGIRSTCGRAGGIGVVVQGGKDVRVKLLRDSSY
jgi:hypothetical protein